jgi:hypothetical protein
MYYCGLLLRILSFLQDRIILVDTTFLPILGRIWKQLPLLEAVVVLTDRWVPHFKFKHLKFP